MQLPSSRLAANGDSLLDAAREGSSEALGALCQQQQAYLLLVAERCLFRGLRAKVGASDIVQQSMLEAHRSIDQFDGRSEAELRAWLAQIVRRNAADEARRYRGTKRRDASREAPWTFETAQEAVALDATPSVLMRKAESDEELIKAIKELPPHYRQVIEMRHRDALPYAEIAVQMAISAEAARKLWCRAIRHLQRTLDAAHEDRRLQHG